MTENELTAKRFSELKRKSEHYFTFTDFLGLSEQSILKSTVRDGYTLFGGAMGCERVMARFGSPEELGYEEDFPIGIIEITAKSEKYAERLTHRDYLGTILGLGLERDIIGDIIIRGTVAYLFIKEDMLDFVKDSLTRVRHTDVVARRADSIPEGELYKTSNIRIQANGERIDAIVAKVFSLSRDDSALLFKQGLVFINGAECQSVSKPLKPGDIVSVRGHGRFIYRGYESLSKKGKLNIDIELYT